MKIFTDIQDSKVQQLNESVISRIEDKIEEIVAHQNSKVHQLNTSIISSIDGIGNLLNNTVHQLNTSVNQNTDHAAWNSIQSFPQLPSCLLCCSPSLLPLGLLLGQGLQWLCCACVL